MEKRVEKLRKQAKAATKEAKAAVEIAEKICHQLEKGIPGRLMDLNDVETEVLQEMMLLTSKPVLYVLNVDESSASKGNLYTEILDTAIQGEKAERIIVCAEMEAQIADFDDLDDRKMFLEEMGLHEPGLHQVIRSSYQLLKLVTYFTAGEKEVRAWTIVKGTKAPQAAGVIHSDFEKGFIRAEVIKYEDYVHFGSEAAVKEAGKMGVEGKEYIVKDGDVVHFRFNV
jgi:GTP-binding protein YchF